MLPEGFGEVVGAGGDEEGPDGGVYPGGDGVGSAEGVLEDGAADDDADRVGDDDAGCAGAPVAVAVFAVLGEA